MHQLKLIQLTLIKASATAFSTGSKTINRYIGVDKNGKDLKIQKFYMKNVGNSPLHWFMLAEDFFKSNPTYGDWENTIIDFKYEIPRSEQLKIKLEYIRFSKKSL